MEHTKTTESTMHWLLAGQTSYPAFARKFMGFTLVVSLYLGSLILIVAAGMVTARIMSALFGNTADVAASTISDVAYFLNVL